MVDPGLKDESAGALRLRLYNRALDRTTLGVLATGSAGRSGVRLEAAVIGSSHLIEVRLGRTVFTEMLACGPGPSGSVDADLDPGWGAVERVIGNGGCYRFQARTLEWPRPRAELERLRERVCRCAANSSEVGLAYRFPDGAAAGIGEYPPETLVFAAARENTVVARTAHCYPSEGLVVLSASEIRLRPDCCVLGMESSAPDA